MRFTVAHELAHHLLWAREGVPLDEQTSDRRIEHYCNAFASHLLFPSRWLERRASSAPPSLELAQAIAADADCSISAATTALNREADWGATLIIWRRAGRDGWAPLTSVRPDRNARWFFEPTPQTVRALSQLGDRPCEIDLPMTVNGEPAVWTGEAMMDRRSAVTFHKRRVSKSAGSSPA